LKLKIENLIDLPLEAAEGAVELDTTELTLDAVVDKVVALAHEAQEG
jgi:cytidylate kinase